MVDALPRYFSKGNPLSDDELAEIETLISKIKGHGTPDEILDRICEFAVVWVLNNQTPITLEKTNYRR